MTTTDTLETTAPSDGTDPETADVDYDLLATVTAGDRPQRPSALSASVTHGWRALLKIKHVPEQLIDVTIFPVMMLVMFTYLFGGALDDEGPRAYLQYFLPGILVTSVVMMTMYTGVGLNVDAEKGVFDRFRSLPMWRPAVIVGMLLGDAVRYAASSVVMISLGLVLGFRTTGGGVPGVLAAVGLLILFAFSLSWIWTVLGLVMNNEKAVMNTSMMIIFPLSFLSNVFVEPETMPTWLERAVDINPISHVVAAARGFMAGEVETGHIAYVLIACAVLVGVFGSLSMRLYNRKD
jgi:ABC-2 type transport system permease protein